MHDDDVSNISYRDSKDKQTSSLLKKTSSLLFLCDLYKGGLYYTFNRGSLRWVWSMKTGKKKLTISDQLILSIMSRLPKI